VRAPAEKLKHLIIHRNDIEAVAAGFAPRESGVGKVRAV